MGPCRRVEQELLFRGLIGGSLSRRLPELWANIAQALIFLLPHLLILKFMPEMSWILVLVFGGALPSGWMRIKSGSISALVDAFVRQCGDCSERGGTDRLVRWTAARAAS